MMRGAHGDLLKDDNAATAKNQTSKEEFYIERKGRG